MIDFFLVADSWNNEIVNIEPEKCDDLSRFEIDNLLYHI